MVVEFVKFGGNFPRESCVINIHGCNIEGVVISKCVDTIYSLNQTIYCRTMRGVDRQYI